MFLEYYPKMLDMITFFKHFRFPQLMIALSWCVSACMQSHRPRGSWSKMGICLHQSKHFAWPHGRKSEGKAKEKERKIKEREKENGRKYSAKNLWSVHPISPTKHCLVSSHVYIKLTKQFDALFNTSNQTDNLHNCI